jgi:hypothetical protein
LGNTNQKHPLPSSTSPIHPAKIVPPKSIHLLSVSAGNNSTPRYIKQQQIKHPKSSFKSLLIVTSILPKHRKMSLVQQVPEGLKPQEVERGNGKLVAPIPFIPEKLEKLDPDRKVPTIKIELENGVESRMAVWEGIGTKEQFLCHMVLMREALVGIGLFKRHEEAKKRVS